MVKLKNLRTKELKNRRTKAPKNRRTEELTLLEPCARLAQWLNQFDSRRTRERSLRSCKSTGFESMKVR